MPTYYVDNASGSNSNSGSFGAPFQTIAFACSGRVAGDVVYVRPGTGTYPESIDNLIPSSVTLARDPAYAFGTVTIRPASGLRVLNFATPVTLITVSGLVCDGVNVASDCAKITSGANRITISDCELKNAPTGQGLLISPEGSDFNNILRCTIHDNGTDPLQHQVYIRTNNNLIESCELYGGLGYGIHQYDGPPTGNIYRRNKIHNTDTGILLSSGSGNFSYYNVLYLNGIDIQVNYSEANTKVWNNTTWGSLGGITLYAGTSGIEVKNNIGWQGTNYNYRDFGSAAPQLATNLFGTDPLFVSTTNRNFRLLPGSPAINAGTNLSLTLDYDGNAVGATPDIGAFEFGVPSAPTNLRRVA